MQYKDNKINILTVLILTKKKAFDVRFIFKAYFYCLLFCGFTANANIETIYFVVKDSKTQKAYYQGYETVEKKEKENLVIKKTYYYSLENKSKVIQKIHTQFSLEDFKTSFYEFSNSKTGEYILLNLKGKSYEIDHKKSKDSKLEKNTKLIWKKNTLSGKSIHEYVLKNWQKLKAQTDGLSIDLLVPARQEIIEFNLSMKEKDKSTQVITMRPKSFFLRMLVDPIEFLFKQDQKGKNQVVQYKGPTSIDLPSGNDSIIMEFMKNPVP